MNLNTLFEESRFNGCDGGKAPPYKETNGGGERERSRSVNVKKGNAFDFFPMA